MGYSARVPERQTGEDRIGASTYLPYYGQSRGGGFPLPPFQVSQRQRQRQCKRGRAKTSKGGLAFSPGPIRAGSTSRRPFLSIHPAISSSTIPALVVAPPARVLAEHDV